MAVASRRRMQLGRDPSPATRAEDASARFRFARWGPLSLLAVPFGVGALRLVSRLGGAFVPAGDLAALELGVRNALQGGQLLGAYSRFGWDQLGPAWFYLVAPVYGLAGSDTRALFLATWLLNGAAAAAVVAVVWRRAGSFAAALAAGAVLAWFLAVTPWAAMQPWNPVVLALPLLLTLVLAAAAAAGSGWSLVGAAAVGSVVTQCHLGAFPVVAVALAVGAAGWWRAGAGVRAGHGDSRPLARSGRRARSLAATGAVAGLALLWAPAVVDQATRRPGNLVLVARFVRDPPGGFASSHPVGMAASTVARQASALPLGRDASGEPGPAPRSRRLVGVGWLASAAVGAAIAGRRKQPFAAACGLVAGVAGIASVVAAARVTGELFPYLVFYATVLPVPVLIGFGTLAAPRPTRPGRALSLAAAFGLGVLLLTATWTAVRTPLEPEPASAEVAEAAALADQALAAADAGRVMVRGSRHELWPVTVGLTLALEQAGYRAVVDPGLVLLVGEDWAPHGREEAEILVATPDDALPEASRPGAAAVRELGRPGGIVVSMREFGPN